MVRVPAMDSEDRKVATVVPGDVTRNVLKVRRSVEKVDGTAVRLISCNASRTSMQMAMA